MCASKPLSMSSGQAVLEEARHDRDLGQGLAILRVAPHLDCSRDVLEIVRARLEQVCRDLDRLVADLRRGALDRAGDHDREPASARAAARQPCPRSRVDDRHALGLDAELLGDALRDHRLGAVAPEGRRVERRSDAAGRVDAERDALGDARHEDALAPVEEPPFVRRVDAALLASDDADSDVAAFLPEALLLAAQTAGGRRARAPCRAPRRSCRCRTRCRRGSCTGTAPGWMKLRRRSSTGSASSSRAARSTMRSITKLCTSEPNPRYAPCWHLFVKTPRARYSIASIRYGPTTWAIALPCVPNAELDVGAVVVDHVQPKPGEDTVRVDRELDVVGALRAVVVAAGEIVEAVLHVLDRAAHDLAQHPGEHVDADRPELRSEAAACGMRMQVQLVRRDLHRLREQEEEVRERDGVRVDRHHAGGRVVARDRADGLERLPARAAPVQAVADDEPPRMRTPPRRRRRRASSRSPRSSPSPRARGTQTGPSPLARRRPAREARTRPR